MKKRRFLLPLILAAPLAFGGCAVTRDSHLEVARLSAPAETARFNSLAVLNFTLSDTLKGEGAQVGDLVAEALVKSRISARVQRVDRFASSNQEAARIAEELGADGAVFGTIDEYFYGGITTASRAVVTLSLIQPGAVTPLWKLSGRASQEPTPPSDRLFYVDSGFAAPMPMVLARKAVESIVSVLSGTPSEEERKASTPAPVAPRDQGGWKSN